MKYLFEAEFLDGTKYKQNKLDSSVKWPAVPNEKGILQGKNCMSDIQEDVDKFNIERFTLIEQALFGRKYTVDLTDGHFEIDGVKIDVEGEKPLPIKTNKYKLIYWIVSTQQHTTPALFNNPQSINKAPTGGIVVINRIGQPHVFPKVAKMWAIDERDILDGVEQMVHKVYVMPDVAVPPRKYCIGWQTTISGKSYQQKIIVE